MVTVPRGTAKRYSRAKSLGPRAQVHCTTWYSLPYGTYPEGPRRGCTVPWRTLRVVRGTVKNAGPDMRDGGNDVNDPQRSSGLNNRNRANAFSRQATQLIDSKSRAVAIGGSGLTRRQTKRNLCRTQSVAPHRQRWSRHRSICVLEKSSDEHFC